MKNKPLKHKDDNVFKYKSFNDRIQDVDIRRTALYYIEHINEDTELVENETHFHQAYRKWLVLNLSQEYNVFRKKIKDIITLPQVIHQKDFIVQLLLDELEKATTLSLQPLLEFIVVLAKDLREEFYPYFPSILNRLISLLDSKDPDQIEWTLICLAFLFKTLKPFLKKDITVVFKSILPLLDNNKEYINNFAAECFSFIVRDIKDKERFLLLILTELKGHNRQAVNGCGRLLFEIIRGINSSLHNCAELFLTLYLNAIHKTECYDQELLYSILTKTIQNLLELTLPQNMQIFWNICYGVIDGCLKDCNKHNKAIQLLLQLLGQALEYRNGKFLIDSAPMITCIIHILDCDYQSDDDDAVHLIASQFTAVILLSPNLLITQLDASRLCKKILNVATENIFESFVWNTVKYSQFDILVFPEFLRYFENNITPKTTELLVKIIFEKSPFSEHGLNVQQWKCCNITFKKAATLKQIENCILNYDSNKTENINTSEEFLLNLIICTHTKMYNVNKITDKLLEITNEYCGQLAKLATESERRCHRIIFILSIIIESLVHFDILSKLPLDNIILTLLQSHSKHIPALKLIHLIVISMDHANLNYDLFLQVHNHLSDNLSSEYHEIRQLTTHILKEFSFLSELKSIAPIYDIFYNVECIIPDILNYREQIQLLERMSTEMQLYRAIENTAFKLDPLKFLLGTLYQNLKLLWKPTSDLIVEYATTLETNEFWSIFKEKLTNTVQHLHKHQIDDDLANDEDTFLMNQFRNTLECNDRLDFINYRILLWKILPQCGHIKEIKNREIITLFLEFIENEYGRTQDSDICTWNITTSADTNEDVSMSDSIALPSDNNNPRSPPPIATQRTLIAKLTLFINIENPTQLYRERDLYALYLELLKHKNPTIEKLALDCILNYKHGYLMPYKEHLYGLINDEQFRKTIPHFKIDKENSIVSVTHREHLMPILMRILYCKMFTKDTNSNQKMATQNRKSIIMRYLAGCYEHEIMVLLKMAFQQYDKYLVLMNGGVDGADDDNPLLMIDKIIADINLENVISAKKLQGSLNLFDIIQEHFGGLMGGEFLKYILNVLFVIGAITEAVLRNGQRINSSYLNIFKTLKNSCITSLINFFTHFDNYPWTKLEIDTVFELFINGPIRNLSNDSIHSPSILLKLLLIFGKNPRYFILLTKKRTKLMISEADDTPLKCMIDLLLNVKTKPKVCLAITEAIQHLLTFSEQSETEDDPDNCGKIIQINNGSLEYEHFVKNLPAKSNQQLNYGSKILLPYLSTILEKIRQNIEKKCGLTKRDLFVLSRCTELITDPVTSSLLLKLLLPILIKKSYQPHTGEEVLQQMVETIMNLFTKVDNPEVHIRDIAPMFEQITAVGPRKLLCNLLENISHRNPGDADLRELAVITKELNAWDRRWVEQPDYERRLNVYKKIHQLHCENRLTLNLGLIVIYHSFYFIKYDKDMAMRDTASYHLKLIVPALARIYRSNTKELDYLIDTVILNIIRRTLRDKQDTIKNESILLLGEMARECPDVHPILLDLNVLTSKEDLEIDFFNNITHLQLHRHGKAMMRLSTILKTIERSPSSRTLTRFILPLVSMYVCNEKYSEKHGIITTAIEAIGVICRLLPWYQYESILKFYLDKLKRNVEYQKQLIRIVMQILDSFHFDLTTKAAAILKPSDIPTILTTTIDEDDKKPVDDDSTAIEINENTVDPEDEDIVGKQITDVDELLYEQLDKNVGDDDDDDEVDDDNAPENKCVPMKKKKICAYDKQIQLSANAVKRIINTIAFGLLPALNKSITVISTYETYHKINKKKRRSEREEEEILRVPISLAMVKLLQKLPTKMLDDSLPGIFIKVCMFLKSPLKSVRMVTRDILKNIMQTVGVEYLHILVNQMRSLLTRGFQVHVLTVTIHGILDVFKHKFKRGQIDVNVQNVLEVCLDDIFGSVADEKEILKIGAHIPEAKPSNKSYLTIQILANNISESCLLDLMIPFKQHLIKSQSKKIVSKVEECFQKIILGLVANKYISSETLLEFIYGTVSEIIPELVADTERSTQLTESAKIISKREPVDCFLIPEEPRNRKTGEIKRIVKTNVRANAHVLIEFGLEMLQIILGRGKLLKLNSYEEYLNPFIPILINSLKSNHIRTTIYALKCFTSMWNREMIIGKLKTSIRLIVPDIMIILHKYATAGMSTTNDNFSLVKNAFKSMVSLIRNVDYFSVSMEQLKTLLLYVEQNLHDTNKQTIAFSLLKVIIERKLMCSEIPGVLKKVSELAILSDMPATRQESKSIVVNYLMEYPLGKKINLLLKFFVTNLNYEVISGRESVIQIIQLIIKRFPLDILEKQSGFLYLSLGIRLVNDDSIQCKKLIAETIEILIFRMDAVHRNQLFDVTVTLLSDTKLSHREMAALLCTRFMNVEKHKFVIRLPIVFPLLITVLTGNTNEVGKFVKLLHKDEINNNNDGGDNDDDNIFKNKSDDQKMEDKQRAIDHQIIQILNTILKMLEMYFDKMDDLSSLINELAYVCQKLLANDHTWIRLNAANILVIILSNINVNKIQKLLLKQFTTSTSMITTTNIESDDEEDEDEDDDEAFLYSNPKRQLKSLTLDLCAQLIPNEIDNDMAECVFKNLLFIANIIQIIPLDENELNEKYFINLIWMIRRVRRVIHTEIALAPKSILLRTSVFRWIESLLELIDADGPVMKSILPLILAPLVREMSDDDKNIQPKLRNLAIKIGDGIKRKIGEDEYNGLRSRLQTKLMIKRAERKKEIAQMKINDPVRAEMRKKGEKERKKVAKKRRTTMIKDHSLPSLAKKKKRVHSEIDDWF